MIKELGIKRNPTQQDLSWFLDLYAWNQIDLNPPYQRKSIWGRSDKKFFLNTIFNNFPCPAIYVQKEIKNGKTMYFVVDGKQRLQTIFDFYNNKLSIPSDFGDSRLDGKKWKDIEKDPELSSIFYDYNFTVEILTGVQNELWKEVFDRLNRNAKVLTDQELRHARFDGWLINNVENEANEENLENDNKFWKNVGIATKGKAARMKDAEFISILALSILMIIREIVDDAKPWLLIIFIVILLAVYLIRKFIPTKIFKRMLGGIVHLDITLSFFILFALAFITQLAGAEFILGTFLAGAIIKSTGIDEHEEQKIASIGYGLFIPIFYILVGFKVSVMIPFDEFITFENILLVVKVFIALLIAKIPFLLLAKWFKLTTSISSIFLVTTTIIVGIACEHFEIFTEELTCAIIIASALTCVIPPILLYVHNKFGYSKEKFDDVVINPNEVSSEE